MPKVGESRKILPVRIPKPATLRRYGLTVEGWRAICERQGWCCAVCRKVPPNGRLCLDHEHVKGWKRMKAEQRATFVRGILCTWCNHWYCGRGITVEKAENVVAYLVAYEERNRR